MESDETTFLLPKIASEVAVPIALPRTELVLRAAKIRLLLLDVDGVLTDGSIAYSDDGSEIKRFHVRDGSGLKFWQENGNRVAILSGRTSVAVERRANELGIDTVLQGRSDKRPAWDELLERTGCRPEEVCSIGDDLADVPILLRSGLAVAVADACGEVCDVAHYVTAKPGGHGAVREAIEWLMGLQGRWADVVLRHRRAD